MTELKFRVKPYGSYGSRVETSYYSIEYREESIGFWSILNFLIPWNYHNRTYHVGLLSSYPDRDHPVLYSHFDDAVKDAEKYKNNPKMLDEYIKQQDIQYKKIYDECDKYHNKRNKSKII